ncbi:MAG: cytochrome P460 family protein [Gammaproteobacteria bacterium]|nr:cytochrome P460 family protein [Gammaproteobacteria bacterium]
MDRLIWNAIIKAGDHALLIAFAPAEGSVVILEVYKPKKDANGKAKGQDGIYEIDKLAAVAVMERRGAWDAAYPKDDRVSDWGFAIYNPNGTPKKMNSIVRYVTRR